MDNYQIFISYRRDGGDALAGRLADRFAALGYRVFFDVESMRSGTFNTQILDAIAQCSDVLVVLPPNALDRCVNPEDWVRQELAFALKQGKNIIPVMMRGFEFPATLPADIDNVRNMEGVTASSEYFDAVIERIERLLSPAIRKTRLSEKQSAPKPSIKFPLFLKTPESRFTPWAQKIIGHHMDTSHDLYVYRRDQALPRSLDEYLAAKRADHETSKRKFEQEKIHLGQFDEKDAIRTYNLFHHFNDEAKKALRKFTGVEDDSLLDVLVSGIAGIQYYVNYLYDQKPLAYQTRIAELLWLYCEFNHPSWKMDLKLRGIMEHVFATTDVTFVTKKLFYGHNELSLKKRYNTYEMLKEVSFTVQAIASAPMEATEKNDQLTLFFCAVWYLRTIHFETKDVPKFKKYLQMNYKYLLKKNVPISDELNENIIKMIDGCNTIIKNK